MERMLLKSEMMLLKSEMLKSEMVKSEMMWSDIDGRRDGNK